MSESYTPHNILVTGGCGFLGSHIVTTFVKKYPKSKIVNLDIFNYRSAAGQKNSTTELLMTVDQAENYKFICGDILSSDLIAYVLETEEIDTIIHCADCSHADFSDPVAVTRNNVKGTHNLLETSRKYNKINRFIQVSTDEVYGVSKMHKEGEKVVVDEEALLYPTNPYAATATGAEFICLSYQKSFHFPIITARCVNTYGPYQNAEKKVVPRFITALKNSEPIPLHGGGSSQRNFIHVSDAVSALVTVLELGTVNYKYNISYPESRSIKSVADDIMRSYGLAPEKAKVENVRDRELVDVRAHLDASALVALGWKPNVSWEDGLRETIEWYKQH